MNRRICAWALTLALLCTAVALPASAAEGTADEALRTVRALGILVGDANGELDLTGAVTRAQFAKMMTVAAGRENDAGAGTGATLFRDVAQAHWAADYIRIAAESGWFVGYSDGTFRPNNTITLEEACTAVLRLLGYDSAALTGAFPAAQLNKAQSVGLRDGLSAVRGEKLTRAQCVTLFYNLMTCVSSGGQLYAQARGYTVTDGKVDYLALVERGLEGPFLCGASPVLPFGTANVTVRRNGTVSALSALRENDVYYYNKNLRAVWAYSDRAAGTLTAVTPSVSAPTGATVAGVSYALSSDAALALSDSGSFEVGDTVTLLLGRSGEAVAVFSAADSERVYYGVALSAVKETAADSATVVTTVRLACTDGTVRTFSPESGSYAAGKVYAATVGADGVSLTGAASKSLSGRFDSAGTAFAGYPLADGVRILELAGDGLYQTVSASRLAGAELRAADVRYWALDEDGALCDLILEDVTGDLWTYGILTEVSNSDFSSIDAAGRYSYVSDGQAGTVAVSGTQYLVGTGGAAFLYADGQLTALSNLKKASVTELSSLWLRADGQKYLLADGLQVYLYRGGSYYAVARSEIDTQGYTLTAWYDRLDFAAGGRVRVLVAVAK